MNTTIATLNNRFSIAWEAGNQSERDKLMIVVEGKKFIDTLDGVKGVQASALYVAAGIDTNSKEEYALAAELVTGLVLKNIKDAIPKKNARNYAIRAAKLMSALDHFKADLTGLTVEETVSWIEDNGGINGTVAKARATDPDIANEDTALDLEEYHRAIDTTPHKLDITTSLNAPIPTISIHQRVGDKLFVLPLNGIPASIMDSLRPYLPSEDAHAPDGIRFFGYVEAICGLFDRIDSTVPLRPNEEQHDGSKMAPSLPIIRFTGDDGSMSIAATRVDTGMVVSVVPSSALALRETKDKASLKGLHLNGKSTRLLSSNLGTARGRASFTGFDVKTDAQKKRWIKFAGTNKFHVRLLEMKDFGRTVTQWTLGVRDAYKATCSATLAVQDGKLPAPLTEFADKASGSKHPVNIKVGGGKLLLSLGKSADFEIPCDPVEGKASVSILSADLARVMQVAAGMNIDQASVEVDPKGLVCIKLETLVGVFSVHVPTLLENGFHSQALLDRIEKPQA